MTFLFSPKGAHPINIKPNCNSEPYSFYDPAAIRLATLSLNRFLSDEGCNTIKQFLAEKGSAES